MQTLSIWFRKTLVPLLLMVFTPLIAIFMWYINAYFQGSVAQLWKLFEQEGFFSTVANVWGSIFFGSPTAWAMILIFAVFQLLFMKILPGKIIEGPITPKGNIPLYKANGVPSFLLTIALFFVSTEVLHLFPATIIYDNFGPLIGALISFSLVFCLFLYFKGHLAPSSTDCGSSGNFIFDYYWGMELYPRVFGWDIKMFTNCRFGMMSWGLIILSFAAKQKELYGLSDSMVVSVLLQLIYIAKFFIWEGGYLRSMDIMHDRAGYYICWGCLVFVPAIYTSPALCLIHHPNHLGFLTSSVILGFGTFCIMINYFADRQRQKVRATEGNCLVWGKKPNLIVASYTTQEGEAKQNLLLASGWWGLARHFHYVPEIAAALCWTIPVLMSNPVAYFYVFFLTILLLDRAFRHERRCRNKYGDSWDDYCEQVPFKVIPFLF
jgi:7-dehydrocholesterol reductase